MGFRFRKSFNLGKGFKLNLSKSGIGYSFGFKGFRIGKTAKGNIRKTFTLPGTGLSYQTETKASNNTVKDKEKNVKKNEKSIKDKSFDEVVDDIAESFTKNIK